MSTGRETRPIALPKSKTTRTPCAQSKRFRRPVPYADRPSTRNVAHAMSARYASEMRHYQRAQSSMDDGTACKRQIYVRVIQFTHRKRLYGLFYMASIIQK